MRDRHAVSRISAVTSSRLVTIHADALLVDAAKLLAGSQIGLVVVCGAEQKMVGVLTKSDVVRQIAGCSGSACTVRVGSLMVRDVVSCRDTDALEDVVRQLQQAGLVHLPVVDVAGRPTGVVNARDALRFLMAQEQYEESLLRDYVMGVGYQ
jgi:predicted transcriptional regulator